MFLKKFQVEILTTEITESPRVVHRWCLNDVHSSALAEKNPELPLPPQMRALNNELEELIVLLG